jgi:hypothetical protein
MRDFERRFSDAIRDPSKPSQVTHTYSGGTISLGSRVNEWKTTFDPDETRVGRVKVETSNGRLERIATARNCLFHNTGATINMLEVLHDMVEVLHALNGVADPAATLTVGPPPTGWPAGWIWHELLTADSDIAVILEITGHRMNIPLPRDKCLVGRSTAIAEVSDAILPVGARVRYTHLGSLHLHLH